MRISTHSVYKLLIPNWFGRLVAAALVPAMQKGNETARVAHIALNVANIALFAWQIPTGIEIMLKVWEKTSW